MNLERSASDILLDLIARAEGCGASDVHLHALGKTARVSFRLDGVIAHVLDINNGMAGRVFGRIKFLAKLKTYQQTLPQDGRISKQDVSARADIRVATYPTVTGEKIVLRMFAAGDVPALDELGFPDDALAALGRFLASGAGLLLLTGPAGSGKTTTIYACLRSLAEQGGRHVITVEDPVERVVEGIMQTEVNEAAGLTFAKAAKHLLRQDPEVLVIGEIRDGETADIAIRAALTGHLVIATLHAGSCRGVYERMFAVCGGRNDAVPAIEMIINQRLVREICTPCGGDGCDACLNTGFSGRRAVVEWLTPDDALRRSIRDGRTDRVEPTVPLAESAARLVEQGITSQAEIRRVLAR